MSPLIVCIVVFVGVTALVVGLSYVMRGDKEAEVEDRLSVLTGGKKAGKGGVVVPSDLLSTMRRDGTGIVEVFIPAT